MNTVDSSASSCQVCANAHDNQVHRAREMMYGLRTPFRYLECSGCGCLQLMDPPVELGAFYPADYYSYSGSSVRKFATLDAALKRLRARAWLGEGGLGPATLGRILLRAYGPTPQLEWLKYMGLRQNDPILDVGCGAGDLLRELQRDGFENLSGVDPFIDAEIDHGQGLRIHKLTLSDLEGQYALVMLHHSFEHMADPASVVREIHRLLRPGGWALIRIPVADSLAWRDYGVDWVQLDAPRHLFLHTRKSMETLARAAGLSIARVDCDGTGFQFWGSELYRQNIALREEDVKGRTGADRFTSAELSGFEQRAAEANARDQGDQAVFYLRSDGE